jgi:hypothetical protein
MYKYFQHGYFNIHNDVVNAGVWVVINNVMTHSYIDHKFIYTSVKLCSKQLHNSGQMQPLYLILIFILINTCYLYLDIIYSDL